MTEERNKIEKTQTKVELQIIPCEKNVAIDKQAVVLNHENQDDPPCGGKIILNITCDGAKLTKADAGYNSELTQEVWVTAKMTKADSGKITDIDVNVHEKCGSKLTKADSGKN
ncbi:MAG: hypothetical protein IPH32_08100 [Bacteroidetes bacterium]|jgi:hypothetical protein|nr:hypothetical protein [Bacteroidota bacterium]